MLQRRRQRRQRVQIRSPSNLDSGDTTQVGGALLEGSHVDAAQPSQTVPDDVDSDSADDGVESGDSGDDSEDDGVDSDTEPAETDQPPPPPQTTILAVPTQPALSDAPTTTAGPQGDTTQPPGSFVVITRPSSSLSTIVVEVPSTVATTAATTSAETALPVQEAPTTSEAAGTGSSVVPVPSDNGSTDSENVKSVTGSSRDGLSRGASAGIAIGTLGKLLLHVEGVTPADHSSYRFAAHSSCYSLL